MVNPFHDEAGRFTSRDEMLGALNRLAESGSQAEWFALRSDLEAADAKDLAQSSEASELERSFQRRDKVDDSKLAANITKLKAGSIAPTGVTKNIYARAQRKAAETNLRALKFPHEKSSFNASELKKINNFAHRFGLASDEVLAQIKEQPLAFLAITGTAYSRQNIYEGAFREHIASLNNTSIEKLPSGGKNALAVIDGKLVKNPPRSRSVKTLDFKVTKGDKVVYVIHKFAAEGGGHQDNQYNDAKAALLESGADQKFYLAAVLDGEYFSTPAKRAGESRLHALQREAKAHPKAFAGTYEEFSSWLAALGR